MEQGYSTYEREVVAVAYCIQRWQHYLEGCCAPSNGATQPSTSAEKETDTNNPERKDYIINNRLDQIPLARDNRPYTGASLFHHSRRRGIQCKGLRDVCITY